MNQRGFATLEIIMVVVIIGILASIAIPNFGNVTEKANTAKIQADLSTIDTAIQMYYMEKGGTYEGLSEVENLTTAGYLTDTPTPPSGSALMNGESKKINSKSYAIDKSGKIYRGALNMDSKENAHAGDFSINSKTSSSSE